MSILAPNNIYEILTPTGFKPFLGILKHESQPSITLTLSDNSTFICAPEHMVKCDGKFIPANNTFGKLIDGRNVVINIADNTLTENLFDVFDVYGHEFISSGLISHNCDFVGSVSTLIDNNFLKTLKPVEPMELAHLPEFLKIWDLPKSRELMEMKGWEYVACLDASYGVRADSSVLKIYLAKSNITLHLVAQMSANDMEIGDFCECANQLLQRYNQPNLIIEMNGPGTAAMEYFHIQAEYENLVHFDPRGKMKGLWAGDKLKNAAVIMLKSYVQRKLVKDYDHDTIAELFSFGKVTKEKWGAMGGNHDDHVMSMLWCIYYVNSPLFYGNISEANIAGMKNPDLILDTDDTIIEEDDAISNLKNPEFHKKELSDAAQYNPYDTDNDSDNSEDRYRVRIIGEDDEEDDQVFYGGFRS